MPYYRRSVDRVLLEWKSQQVRNPLLLRGARQVGKSSAVRELGKTFRYFVEVNLEKQPSLRNLFTEDIDVKSTCEKISGTLSIPIVAGETLLFIDEIQVCREAVMALRYFKEDYPELHVIAAGSLLEFALNEVPSFAVGRIRSIYMYPFSFDEFLSAQGLDLSVDFKRRASSSTPLNESAHRMMVEQLRSFYLVGGMPAAVAKWCENRSYIEVGQIHNDIIETYQDDFAKYRKRVSPTLLRKVLHSVALQAGGKFVYSSVDADLRSSVVKDALNLLVLAGLVVPVKHTNANGIPLGAEENDRYVKYLFFDLGVMLTLLGIPVADILLASDVDLVNRGAASEMFAGLELQKYQNCFHRTDLHYWQNVSRNCQAEIDYLTTRQVEILPIEVKANTKGSMQSLWQFMRLRNLHEAVRMSLENFGEFYYQDPANSENRHVETIPLYAVSSLFGKEPT